MKKEIKIKNLPNDSGHIFRLLFETSIDGILILLSDGSIITANPSACEMIGSSEKELKQVGLNGFVVPDHQQSPMFQEGRYLSDKAQAELLIMRKGGSTFPAEASLSVFEAGADCKMAALVIRDITERKRVEEDLKALNKKISIILNTVTDIYIVYDCDGHFTDLNRQAELLIGKNKDEVIGKHLFDEFPQTKKEYIQSFKAALASQSPMYFESVRLFGKWLESYAYPTEDGLITYSRDITKRKLTEKQLEVKTNNLEETNVALKVLLRQLEESKKDLETKMLSNIRELVLPHIDKLKNCNLSNRQLSLLNIIESNLDNIASSFLQQLKLKYLNLTPREIEVATLVKEGRSIKEIADFLNITTRTVEFHRNSLREKLGLKNIKSNLRSYLLNIQ